MERVCCRRTCGSAAGAVDRRVTANGFSHGVTGRPLDGSAKFLADVHAVAASLPTACYAVNLCEDRYAFMVGFCAVASRGQTNLLPPSRAPHAIEEVLAGHPGSYALGDTLREGLFGASTCI